MYAKAHLGKIKSWSKHNVKFPCVMHVVYMGNQDVLVCFLMFLFCNAKIWDEVDFDVAVKNII